MSTEVIVEVRGPAKQFGKFVALQNINLQVHRGEILTLLGPSGCGKTTVMRIIAGFEAPTSGELLLNGRNMAPINRNVSPSRAPS